MTHPDDAMARLFDAAPGNDLPPVPRYNICPTNPVLTVTGAAPEDSKRRLRAMRWGFLPRWYKTPSDGPLIFNARAETIATRPAFREAVKTHRCLIPASGFYEWTAGPEGARLPWYITRRDGAPMVFAGIWRKWEGEGQTLDSCAIVTTQAGPDVAPVHDREPVILAPEDWALWLGEAGLGAATLMRPSAPDVLTAFRVDPAVNSNRASGPALIRPLAA